MEKDFDRWNEQKKTLEHRQDRPLFKEGEVWWCSVGINVGQESCGKGRTFRRPVLIFKKLSMVNFIGIPLSTKIKEGTWFTDVIVEGHGRTALLYQIRMFSINRFQRRLTVLNDREFLHIKQKLEAFLELPYYHQDVVLDRWAIPKTG